MAPHRLCKRCESLDFKELLQKSLFKDKTLGTWAEVKQRSAYCDFCWLAAACIVQTHHPSVRLRDSGKIKLGHKEAWYLCIAHSTLDGEERVTHYTNQHDLESYAKKYPAEQQYCLTIAHADYVDSKGRIQYVVKGFEDKRYASFLGRPVRQDQVHVDLLRSWLERCEHYHGSSCEHEGVLSGELPIGFRVIDLARKRIVPYPSRGTQYIALSYVWGGEKNWAQTMRSHIRYDAAGSEVIYLPQNLPATIADALNLAHRLGFRYIWVDSLCIVQDDAEDKDRQIGHMDAVYNSATLTIAAGSSPHADYGLHGLSIPRVEPQTRARVQGLDLAVVFPTFEKVDSARWTVWNSRAWTLQEKIFSRRILFFTDRQVYFKCNNAIWSEDVRMETKHFSKHVRRRQTPFAWAADRRVANETPFGEGMLGTIKYYLAPGEKKAHLGHVPNYMAVVSNYTARQLSYPEDALKAIDGVLRTLYLGKLHAGIPSKFFRFLLLWGPPEFTICERSDVQLPSWSWAAHKFQACCTWFVQLDEPTWKGPVNPTNSYVDMSQDYVENKDERFRILTRNGWESVGTSSTKTSASKSHFSPDLAWYLDQCGAILSFNCERQGFTVGKPCHENLRSVPGSQYHRYYELTDKHGKCIGEALIKATIAQAYSTTKLTCLRLFRGKAMRNAKIHHSYYPFKYYYPPQHSTNGNLKGNSVMSKSRDFATSAAPGGGEYSSRPSWNGRPGIVNYERDPEAWIIIHVLLVEWVAPDVARRVGIGRVIGTAWGKDGSYWNPMIRLEKRDVYLI